MNERTPMATTYRLFVGSLFDLVVLCVSQIQRTFQMGRFAFGCRFRFVVNVGVGCLRTWHGLVSQVRW